MYVRLEATRFILKRNKVKKHFRSLVILLFLEDIFWVNQSHINTS